MTGVLPLFFSGEVTCSDLSKDSCSTVTSPFLFVTKVVKVGRGWDYRVLSKDYEVESLPRNLWRVYAVLSKDFGAGVAPHSTKEVTGNQLSKDYVGPCHLFAPLTYWWGSYFSSFA
jgi:hypothetical protein